MTGDASIDDFGQSGRIWFRRSISSASLMAMDIGFATDGKPGQRWSLQDVRRLIREVTRLAQQVLPEVQPVRVVSFDKTQTDNWALGWHQDRVIVVRERADFQGFSNWTRKNGVWHVEPPVEILEQMFFARVHLDAADERNGALEISLGSHLRRKIVEPDIGEVVKACPVELCVAELGDVLFAKALTLHRSTASAITHSRRAVRIDYSSASLPPPLLWEADT
jgi:phenylpyruvate tautomerase PptA (4-oxalocrotonate tautomerase family)